MVAAEEHEVEFVDLVCVNLYPFERTAARRGTTDARGDREHRHRRADDDPRRGQELRLLRRRHAAGDATTRSCRSSTTPAGACPWAPASRSPPRRSPTPPATTRRSPAGSWRSRRTSRRSLMAAYEKVTDLAYGENPHQRAAYYSQVGARMHVLSMVRQVAGRNLSFNNVLDLDAGRLLVAEFEIPACAIIKHNNPCGVAIGATARRGLRAGVRVRPAVGLRRGRVPQPPGRRRGGGALVEPVLRGAVRRGLHRRRAGAARGQAQRCASSRTTSAAGSTSPSAISSASWAACSSQDRDIDLEDRSEMEVVTERKPSEARVGRDAVRAGRCASTFAPTRSCSRASSRRWASAPGR